ncbi:MAG: MFS transporter [Vicinamibacteria bacterium]|nr:MFS transporter [Vicinamibacteria bacterium]
MNRPPLSERAAWSMVFLCTLAYICSFIDRYVLGILVQPIKTEFALTDTQMGLLLGPAFAIFYATMGLPMGWITDRVRRTWMLGVATTFWSLATGAMGFVTGFGSLFASRMAVGIGEAALSPGALSMIADSFPRRKRGAPIAVYSTALALGAGLASLLGASILAYAKQRPDLTFLGIGPLSPWRFTFLVVSAPGFIIAPLFFLLREPPRGLDDVEGEKPVRGLGDGLAWVKGRLGTYLGLVSLVCVMTIIAYGQGGWNASLFERNWGWAPERFATINGLINLLVGPLAVLAAGRWADAWSKKVPDAPLRVLLAGALVMIPCASAAPLMPTATLGFIFLALATAGTGVVSAVGVLSVLEITPAVVRGQVVALYYMAISLSGLFLGPPVVGWLSDHVFGPQQLRWAMATLPILFGALPLVLASRTRSLYLQALARQK